MKKILKLLGLEDYKDAYLYFFKRLEETREQITTVRIELYKRFPDKMVEIGTLFDEIIK